MEGLCAKQEEHHTQLARRAWEGTTERLAENVDVLIENFRPGTMEKMGLAPEVLHQHNPKLVIVRISGFGQTGPYKHRPGFGTLVEAMSGFAYRNGFEDREPVLLPLAMADMIAGMQGAFAVMTAIREVEMKDGNGQVIDLSARTYFLNHGRGSGLASADGGHSGPRR